MPHSCPHVPGHCDVITPPNRQTGQGRNGDRWDRYLFMLYRLTSMLEERIGSNEVIRGTTVCRHIPAANPYHTSCAKFVRIHWCFLGGKTVGPRAPVSKMESKTFHRRKGTLQAFSRSLDIDELVLLVFGGWMLGRVTCYCRIYQG